MIVSGRLIMAATAIAAIVLVTACASSLISVGTQRVSPQTDRTSYGPGATVTVTVTNVAAEPVQVRSCQVQLQHRSGTQWESTELPGACVSSYTRLAPGTSLMYGYVTTPGTYRLFLPEVVAPDGPNIHAADGHTNEFAIPELATPQA